MGLQGPSLLWTRSFYTNTQRRSLQFYNPVSRSYSTAGADSPTTTSNSSTLTPKATLDKLEIAGPKNGLEDFFDHKEGWVWSSETYQHAKGWGIEELSIKSFEDLHKLYWTCIKELNKLYSQNDECRRFQLAFPHERKVIMVRNTVRNIRTVLWKRRVDYVRSRVLLNMAQKKEHLIESGLSEEEVEEEMKVLYPFALPDLGLDPRKYRKRTIKRFNSLLRKERKISKKKVLSLDVL